MGTVTCATDTTPAIPTTDALNYTILYQSVPLVSASAGLLTTFLQMNVYGITQEAQSTSSSNLTSTSAVTAIALTNSARASVFPMAYFNVRTGAPALKRWWGQPYNELVIAHHLSAGIGLNPNTGTTQVEFFAGDAISFSRIGEPLVQLQAVQLTDFLLVERTHAQVSDLKTLPHRG